MGLCLGPYGGSGRRRFFVIEVSLWCLPPRGMVKGGANARAAWGCRVWRHAGDTGVPRSQETGILKTLALFVEYMKKRATSPALYFFIIQIRTKNSRLLFLFTSETHDNRLPGFFILEVGHRVGWMGG